MGVVREAEDVVDGEVGSEEVALRHTSQGLMERRRRRRITIT